MKITALSAMTAALGATAIAMTLHVALGHEGLGACLPEVGIGILAAVAAGITGAHAKHIASARKG